MQGQSLTERRHIETEEMLQELAREREQAIFDRTEQYAIVSGLYQRFQRDVRFVKDGRGFGRS